MQQNEAQSKAINAELVNIDCDDIAKSRMEGQNNNPGRTEISMDATYQNGKKSFKGDFLRQVALTPTKIGRLTPHQVTIPLPAWILNHLY